MTEMTPQRTLRFSDLSEILRRAFIPMLAVAISAVILVWFLPGRVIPYRYCASAELICVCDGEIPTDSRYTENLKSLILSRSVLEPAAEALNFDGGYEELRRSVSAVSDSDIVSVSVTCKDEDEAKIAADVIVSIASDKIGLFGDGTATVRLREAQPASKPVNSPNLRHYIVTAVFALAATYILAVIHFALGESVLRVSDIPSCTGLEIAGELCAPRRRVRYFLSERHKRSARTVRLSKLPELRSLCDQRCAVITVAATERKKSACGEAMLVGDRLARDGVRVAVLDISGKGGSRSRIDLSGGKYSDTSRAVLRTNNKNLKVLACGINRRRGLSGECMSDLLDRLSEGCDCVIAALPERLAREYGTEFAAMSDAVMLSVRRRKKVSDLFAAARRFDLSDGKHPCVLINRKKKKRLASVYL